MILHISSLYQKLRCVYLYYTHLFPLLINYLVTCSSTFINISLSYQRLRLTLFQLWISATHWWIGVCFMICTVGNKKLALFGKTCLFLKNKILNPWKYYERHLSNGWQSHKLVYLYSHLRYKQKKNCLGLRYESHYTKQQLIVSTKGSFVHCLRLIILPIYYLSWPPFALFCYKFFIHSVN